MLGIALLHNMMCTISTVLGSVGVFFVYISFLKPDSGADAIILPGAASALVWATIPDEKHSPNGRIR
jgi:hypothetical protein